MPADDIYQVTVEGQLHGSQVMNVYHFKGSNGFSSLADLIADVIDCVRTALLPALSNEYKLIAVRGKTIHPALSDEIVQSATAADIGGINADSDVSFAAAVMSLRTGLGGRSNRGRKYIAGIPESGIVTSRLTSGELTLLLAFAVCLANKFIAATSTDPYFIGVLRKKLVAAGQTPLQAFIQCNSISVTNVVGTQRRRKVGVGS